MRRVWTREAYDLLYRQLVLKFGPYNSWENITSPGKEQSAEFERFCELFAQTIGANSARAVQHQISWSLPIPADQKRDWPPSRARNAILNMAAAFNAGFIDNTAFPHLIANGPPSIANWPPEPHWVSEPERWAELQSGVDEPMGEDQ